MSSSDLAPDHSDFGSPDFPLCAVDICNLLAEVETARISGGLSRRTMFGAYSAALGLSTPSIWMMLEKWSAAVTAGYL